MKIKLKYFGMVAEVTDTNDESLEVEDHININKLKLMLESKYNSLNSMTYKIAVNQSLKEDVTILHDNDEVVLLPPFAGG
jgi:sulfur-carrier protein